MDQVQATVQYRQMEYVDSKGWPTRFYINPENYRRFLDGEDGITGVNVTPGRNEEIRVRGYHARDLKVTGDAEPGTFLADMLEALDQFLP